MSMRVTLREQNGYVTQDQAAFLRPCYDIKLMVVQEMPDIVRN